jgi:tRNA dimethylallyltransferase
MELVRRRDDIELVSMDSMQVYRGMDIGTAKPSLEEQARAHHHLIDIVDPWEAFSAAAFQRVARQAVTDIEGRGKRAVLVGGTGLYLQAVIDDLRFPGEDLELRRSLERDTSDEPGRAAAFARLQQLDPDAAARIEPGNVRRIVRALEVIELTGKPFSSFGPGLSDMHETVFPVRLVGLRPSSSELAERIEARARSMFDAGLVAEVEGLMADPRGWSRTARQAIGYKETEAHLHGDPATLTDTLDAVIRRTRTFARRQRAWFQRDPRIDWIEAGDNSGAQAARTLASWEAI